MSKKAIIIKNGKYVLLIKIKILKKLQKTLNETAK